MVHNLMNLLDNAAATAVSSIYFVPINLKFNVGSYSPLDLYALNMN
jgi:hypothetical protein